MKEMLKIIVETDKASRLEVQKAADEREGLSQELEKKKNEINKKYEDKASERIKCAKEEADKEIALANAQIKEQTDSKKQELTKLYEKDRSFWVKHIVDGVTEQ